MIRDEGEAEDVRRSVEGVDAVGPRDPRGSCSGSHALLWV